MVQYLHEEALKDENQNAQAERQCPPRCCNERLHSKDPLDVKGTSRDRSATQDRSC